MLSASLNKTFLSLCAISIKSFDFTLRRPHRPTFQQDDVHAHTARATIDLLQLLTMSTNPALSPDFNLIEHLWDEIQTKPNAVRPRPITAADQSVAVFRIWAAIPMAYMNLLIHSTYRRCVSVVNAHGGHTRYWLVAHQRMPAMLYVLLGTMGKHSPASGEDACKKITFHDDFSRTFLHLKKTHWYLISNWLLLFES